MDIIVMDLEVNKEFNLVSITEEDGKTWVIIYNEEYGHCRQESSKIRFKNKHDIDPMFTLNDMKKCWADARSTSSKMIWDDEWVYSNTYRDFDEWYKKNT